MSEPETVGARVLAGSSVRTVWRLNGIGAWVCQCCGISKTWGELLEPVRVE
jgi:hypothetical protein